MKRNNPPTQSHPTQTSINRFFQKKSPTPTTPTTPILLEESDQTPTLIPHAPPPSKAKRCGKFDSLEKHINTLTKCKVEGAWRKHQMMDLKLAWTEIIQTFEHIPSGRQVEIYHFAPYGMAQYIAHYKSIPSCSSSFQALPKEIQVEMSDLFTTDSFNKTDIVVARRNTDQKAPKHFYRFVTSVKRRYFQRFLKSTRNILERMQFCWI